MALIPTEGVIPLGGEVIMSKDALEAQKTLIDNWIPQSEVWPLKYGHYILGVASGICGMYINNCFRQKLQLRQIGAVLSYISLGAAPGATATLVHSEYIRNKMLLYKTGCPVCLETKASLYQTGIALIYPLMVAPIINLGIAAGNGYQIPHASEVKEVARFWIKVVRPAVPAFSGIVAFNMLFAGFLTYKELLSMNTVQQILLCVEEDYILQQNTALNNK